MEINKSNYNNYVNKLRAIQNPNATEEHISKVLDNPKEDWTVKQAALMNTKSTEEHISKVLDNPDEQLSVKETAKEIYNERFGK